MNKALWLTAVIMIAFMVYTCDPPDRAIGDSVCLKANGKRGVITWSHYGNLVRSSTYRVQSVNDLNQVYDAEILEADVEDCKIQDGGIQ